MNNQSKMKEIKTFFEFQSDFYLILNYLNTKQEIPIG